MKQRKPQIYSRRRFLGTAATGMAGIAMIPGISSCVKPAAAGSDITLGFIGLGRQAMFLLDAFSKIEGVKVVAGCDVYGRKRTRFENRVNEFYSKAEKSVEVKTYEKYSELLARQDIDAVVVATPDHWHALIAIAAIKAGKDVYLEKPMTFTIKEGQELVKTVRSTDRVLGIGSQQRSDPSFQHAVKLAQTGALGQLEKINAYVGAPPTPYLLPEEELPEDLNWNLWLGPLPADIHYNKELNPPYRWIRLKTKNSGAAGDGTRKWAVGLPRTGVPICLTLLSGDLAWMEAARWKPHPLATAVNSCISPTGTGSS